MSSFFRRGDSDPDLALDKEEKGKGQKLKSSSMPKKLKKVVGRSFDKTASNKNEALQPKRSSMPGIERTDTSPRRSSVDVVNNAVRSAVFAPVMAGKAVMQGSVKAVQESVKAGQLVVDQSIKTTTNIAKASQNAVVGGGKAIVGGTSSAVEYGGKRFVEGTKGVYKGIKSAATLKGFTGRNLEEKKSKWEQGIEVIESLLEPGTDTYKAMTPEQRKQLASVKKLLITAPGGSNKIAHIPRDLIKMKKSESVASPSERRLSSNFILQEYAGVNTVSAFGESLDLDMSDSSDEGCGGNDAALVPKRDKSPVPAKTVERQNSNESLSSLKQGFGNLAHDDPTLDVANFVPVEFTKMSKDDKLELMNMLSWNSINKWDFDIFRLNKITKRRPLLFIGWAILGSPYSQSAMAKEMGLDYQVDDHHGYPFMDELTIPPQKLCDYLRVIELDYRSENSYHNAIHAADVMQSLHTLIQMSLEEDFLRDCPSLKLFTILLAAAIHDVDHPGKTNAFHTQMRTELAVMYNDKSVLENWHVAHAFARMLDIQLTGSGSIHESHVVEARRSLINKSSNTNILCNAHPEQFNTIRNLMIEAVLHTDMTKHFEMVNAAKGLLRQECKEDNTWKLLMYMLHMADISGQAKAAPLFCQWTDRCMNEFFAQGDEEAALGLPISPNCDRQSTVTSESQVGFIKFVVEPAYEVLGMFVPFVQHQVLPIIHNNLDYWVEQMEKGIPRNLEGSSQIDASSRSTLSQTNEPKDTNKAACKDESTSNIGNRTNGQVGVEG